MIIIQRNRESVVDKLKMKELTKSFSEITEGEIISLDPDPLHKKEDIFSSLMSASISSNQS